MGDIYSVQIRYIGFKNLLTDGCDKPIEVAVGEKWLRKLSEKQLQRSGDDVHVLPLAVLEVQFLCLNTTGTQFIRAQQGELLSTERSCSESSAFPGSLTEVFSSTSVNLL